MKSMLLLLALVMIAPSALAQDNMPEFTIEALVTNDTTDIADKKDYTLMIYGAIGCSYSRYLLENLNIIEACEPMEIIILLNDSKEAIQEEYAALITKYRMYSNDVLKHQLTKNKDITPQTFLFKNKEQLLHFKGIKKNMFVKIDKAVRCK